jgi:hypothetical protein
VIEMDRSGRWLMLVLWAFFFAFGFFIGSWVAS